MFLLASGAAPAQVATAEPEDGIEEVLVTGSRIVRSDATAPSPITVVGAEQLQKAGTLSITETLRQDPSIGSQSAGPTLTMRNAGRHSVDLRNLGGSRTLTLVNGKRLPLYSDVLGNSGQDISAVPSAMIGRIEILRDGASTAYGADAVAGVVNIILDDDFDGAQLEAYSGISTHGDGDAYRLSGKIGTTFDRGAVMFVGHYSKQNDIWLYEREWGRNVISSIGAQVRGRVNGPGGLVYGESGQVIACYPHEGGATNLAPDCPTYDANQYSLIGATELRSVGGLVRYDLADSVTLSVDAFYSNRLGSNSIPASRQLDTRSVIGPFPNGFSIPATSAANPYGEDVTLFWRPSQYGPQTTDSENNTYWASLGLSGSLGERFDWEVSHTYSRASGYSSLSNVPNAVHLRLLLNPDECAQDPLCAPVGGIDSLADLLSQATPLTDAQRDYLLQETTNYNVFDTQQTIATIGGELFSLPAGAVDGVIGYERREESGEMRPDSLTSSGEAVGSFAFPGGGKYTTDEVFAEVQVPLLADAPGVYELDLNLQGRYSDFSNFGGADTWKVSVNYSPIRAMRLRATYGTSFRAPDILDLYGGGVGATGIFQDPCNASGLRSSSAQVDANCDALGVPEDFEQAQPSLPTRGGGNPALEPENGKAFTVGVVLTPDILSGFTASIDYYDFEITDAISGGQLQQNINACYNDPNLISRAADINDICYTFADRGPSGSLNRVLSRSLNIAELSTSGIDLAANLRIDDVGPGSLTVDARISHLLEYESAGVDYTGQFVGFVEGASSYPEWRGNLTARYDVDDFAFSWRTNYVSAMDDFYAGVLFPVDNFLGYTGTPSYFSHDLLVDWYLDDRVEISFGMNNVFDRDPPYAFETARGTLPTTFDNIGRYFFGTLRFSF